MVVASYRGVASKEMLFSAARARLALDAATHLIGRLPFYEPGLETIAQTLAAANTSVARRLSRDLDLAGGRIIQNVRTWLQLRLNSSKPSEVYEVLEQAAEPTSLGPFDGDNVVLEQLDMSELDLQHATMRESAWERCNFERAMLAHATFDDAVVVECGFERACLSQASLRRAHFDRCRFSGVALDDSTLDTATFIDCDLRGADLSAPKLGAQAATLRVDFVRCDLRESRWRGRHLRGVRLVDCKLHGAFGKPTFDSVEIEGSDLSAAGDGSEPAKAPAVLDAWRR